MTDCTQVGTAGQHSTSYYDEKGVCAWCAAERRCGICKRWLDSDSDPLSGDCGGDCAYCMLQVEAGSGGYDGAFNLAMSIAERCHEMTLETERG